ncbi:MAG: RsmB/NOP family class I SAM-dependent RNA methyltransferase [Pararhodobacter sp.]
MPKQPPRQNATARLSGGQETDPARHLAVTMLTGVLQDRQTLDEQEPANAPPDIRARARRLALATLRDLQRADSVLSPLLRKAPPPRLHALLRLSVVEMLALNAPPHAVVHTAVALARAERGGAALAGMVNAVLRRASATGTEGWQALPVPRLPGWMRRRLTQAHGSACVAAIEAAHHAGAPLDLTLAPMPHSDRQALVQALSAVAGPVQELPGGTVRLGAGVKVSALPGHAEGRWWVQDAAAALPVALLAPRPGEPVLDLCAAPGGKTMQLAAAGARVTALDRSSTRLERVHANLARTGLRATVICADALTWEPAEPVDAILLDAPCTATGTIRRHPELPLLRKPADLESLVALQAQLINRAAALLRPGGRMVYCTCSLLAEEGEAQLAAALARNPGLRLAQTQPLPLGTPAPGGGWRTRPDDTCVAGGLDGFFMAMLVRD